MAVNAVHELKFVGSEYVFALVRFVVRRISKSRFNKSRWFRRIALGFTILRWLQNRLARPESIVLAQGEVLEVGIARKEGKDK